VVALNIIAIGKESLDIEIDNRIYRLSGENETDGFIAWVSQTALLTKKHTQMPLDERKELSCNMVKSTPTQFTTWLNDKTTSINTNLIELDEANKHQVMERICKTWTEGFKITFLDDSHNIVGIAGCTNLEQFGINGEKNEN
jgi:hypothetical protein